MQYLPLKSYISQYLYTKYFYENFRFFLKSSFQDIKNLITFPKRTGNILAAWNITAFYLENKVFLWFLENDLFLNFDGQYDLEKWIQGQIWQWIWGFWVQVWGSLL